MNDLPRRLRAQIRPLLPEGASLRRAQGDWLFATDALHRSEKDPSLLLADAGFQAQRRGGMLQIRPGADLIVQFELGFAAPTDDLCQSMLRFCGRSPCMGAVALFAAGARLLECADSREILVYDRRVRQLAAVCLRQNLGGAYACALLNHAIRNLKGESI